MQEYNICFSLDSKYTEQFTVSAVSILQNAVKDENINFYILDGGLTEKDKSNIELLKNIKAFNVEYIAIDEKDFKDCPMLKEKGEEHKDYHVTLPTYFRFKLPELLPKLDKVLYLDCDVIVRTSLKELFSVPLNDKAVAMVEDVESKSEAERLGVKKYFNAGVMLINFDYWRSNNVSGLLFDYAKKNKKKILWQDQDVINAVLDGKIKGLNLKWNYQYFLYNSVKEQDLSDCAILHFAGRFKPWLMPFEHFIYDYYYHFLALTPFKNRIIEYKQKGSGKHLKDNIGGSETNIVLDVLSDDVQKIYQEITKNYEYVNEQKSSIITNTDEKIGKVYDEISKNYEYTNEQKSLILTETDEKIGRVYDEITKNYEYTNEIRDNLSSTLYNELNNKENSFNEKLLVVENNLIKDIDSTKNDLVSRLEDVNSSASLGLEELKTILDLNVDFTKKEITTLYEKIAFNDEIFRKDLNELREEFIKLLNDKLEYFIAQTDEKIGKVYDEISKNYEFTKQLVSESNYRTDKVVAEAIENAGHQTDEKIGKVYDEISKNYDYTNKLAQENKDLIEKQIFKTKEDMFTYIDHMNDETSNKLENLKVDVEGKITDLEQTQNRKNDLKLNEVYTYTNSELTKVFATLNKNNSNYEHKLEYAQKEAYRLIEEGKNEISNLRVELDKKKEIEADFTNRLEKVDFEHKKQVEVLTAEFEERFNNQRIKYEKKLMKMEEQITDLEVKYAESQKGFFAKMIERCKKR